MVFEEDRTFESLEEVTSTELTRLAPFVATVDPSTTLPTVRFVPHPTAQGYTYQSYFSNPSRLVMLHATFSAAWLGAETKLQIPDLSGVVELDDQIVAGPSVNARAEHSTLGVTDLPLSFALRAPGPTGAIRTSAGF